ncbi:hypothetical protein PILCRDRAFT_754997 [Piloderma croceum F 1598]|uniref:Uncharacterized protein n=1 Tax=Piloderma croceum (strain F 1598) TaxID=765440 RepID=A0A0C3ETJ0_PILCF|nr:hypothetical protein PILCRDRAFT_754997 [Piloderma croceum F 1598]
MDGNGILLVVREGDEEIVLLEGTDGDEGMENETIISQLHILCVNKKDLQMVSRVGNAGIDLAIKSAKSSRCRIDGGGSTMGNRQGNNVFKWALIPSMSVNNCETTVLPEIGASPGEINIDEPYKASISDFHSD